MAPMSRKRGKKAGADDDGDAAGTPASQRGASKGKRKGVSAAAIGALALAVFVSWLAFSSWKRKRDESEELLRVLACSWEKCADPAQEPLLKMVAEQAAEHKGQHGQDLPPQRAMWTYCIVVCMSNEKDFEPSPHAMGHVAPILEATQERNLACSDDKHWTLDVAGTANQTALSTQIAATMEKCGLVRLRNLWDAADSSWMDAAFQHFQALEEVDRAAWGRIETAPRRTEDVLVPPPDLHNTPLWHGLARFLSQPLIAAALAKYFDSSGSPRLSYASWIVAPPSGRKVAEPQPLHSDLNFPKAMVSAHLALTDITTVMGPTAYCPGTHFAGGDKPTDPAGPAGPLELSFALRTVALKQNSMPCTGTVPRSTPKGTVTIYDSAVMHRGEANLDTRSRVLLNLNIAGTQRGIDEEAYGKYFKGKVSEAGVNYHLEWLRATFDTRFYKELMEHGMGGDPAQAAAAAESIVTTRLNDRPVKTT